MVQMSKTKTDDAKEWAERQAVAVATTTNHDSWYNSADDTNGLKHATISVCKYTAIIRSIKN